MSDYRDPRDPLYRDPAYDALSTRSANEMRAQSYSPGMAAAWFVGIALFIGVLIFAFGGSDQQVAGTDTTPPSTSQSTTPPAANPPAPTTPAPTTPPAQKQ
jgi:hypothetical protein